MINKKKINLFETFAGIGSQHQALKNLGYKVNLIGLSEWYIDALLVYNNLHLGFKPKKENRAELIEFLKKYNLSRNSKESLKSFSGIKEENLSIIKQVIEYYNNLNIENIKGKDIIKKEQIDIFTYSFPCQDISQQGKACGFSKGCKTRSGLLWEVERVLTEVYNSDKNKLPKILLMENVKSLLSSKFNNDLTLWINSLSELGYYSTKPFIFNSANIGEAQNRERVFMISFLGKKPKEFILSEDKKKKQKLLRDIIDLNDRKRDKFIIRNNMEIIKKYTKKDSLLKKGYIKGYTTFDSENYVYYLDGIAPTLTATGAQSRIKFFGNDNNIYYLTAKEHFLLQGFTDKDYDKIKEIGLNENKIKFLTGNSINIKVLEAVFDYYLNQ